MARSVRPLRFVVVVVVAALVALGLSGCVADPPPTMGTAAAGDARAVVSWQPPLAVPTRPISGYVVTPWIGFTRQTPVVFNSSATTQTVTGLTNGVTYTFTVHALNAHGDESAESGMSNPVTPAPPVVGPEFPVSDPVYGPNRHGQSAQTTAFDGTNYFVVWTDQRNPYHSQNWGARVAADGTVLDPTGIPLPVGGTADVTFDGTNYLVVGATPLGVAVVRVSTSGVVLDQTPIQINANVTTLTAPMVARGNGSSLIVWWACEPTGQCDSGVPAQATYQVLGARIASGGTVLDPSPIRIAQILQDSYFNIFAPNVAFDGTNYLVTFGRPTVLSPIQYGIGARQVSGAGVPLGSQDNILVSGLSSPSGGGGLSFDGTNFFLLWNGPSAAGPGRVRGMRVSPDPLGLLDPSGFDISTDTGGTSAVTFDGANTLVAWAGSTGMLVRRIDGTGTPVDPSPIPLPGVTAGIPVLAAGTGQVLLAFTAGSSPTVIDAVRIDGVTSVDNPPLAVSSQANDQTGEAIASNGTGSFVVWNDDRSGTYDIYGARVQNGSMLDGTGILISTSANPQGVGAVAFDGTGYLVVWSRSGGYGSNIYGARVTADGVVLDPGGIQITNTPAIVVNDHPAVAFDGTNYLVVWDACPDNCGVSVARVGADGTVLDPGGVVLTTTNGPSDPTVAFGGGCYFVAWQTKDMYNNGPYFAGERVGTDLAVPDAAPLSVFHVSSPQTAQAVPQVAFNGTDFLVVWQDGNNKPDIIGTRVTPAGAVLDYFGGLAISSDPHDQTAPHIVANGDGHFLVIWRDNRGPNANSPDIYGARVTDAGVVLDPSGVAIAYANQGFTLIPTIAPNASPGSLELAYTRFAPEPPYGSFRVFHRSVNLN